MGVSDPQLGEVAALTLPRSRVISSTKWEVNMIRKYHIASSAMVPRIVGILSFAASDLDAMKTINENARESGRTYCRKGQPKWILPG